MGRTVIAKLIQPVGEPMATKRTQGPTIRRPMRNANRGLPKTERLKRLCVMLKGDKFQAVKSKKDDAENPSWQRSLHSNLRRQNRSHGEGRQLLRTKIEVD